MRVQNNTTVHQPIATSRSNKKPFYAKAALAGVAALAVAASVYKVTEQTVDIMNTDCDPTGVKDFDFPMINRDCVPYSWTAFAEENKDQLEVLLEDQRTIDGEKLFYYDPSTKYAPITVPLEGALRTSTITDLIDKSLRVREFSVNATEIAKEPKLIDLKFRYEQALSKWHDGKQISVESFMLSTKRIESIASMPFHIDGQKDNQHFSISAIPLEDEFPISLLHKDWKTIDGNMITIVEEDYRREDHDYTSHDITVYNHDTGQIEERPVSDLKTPLCVPPTTSRVVPGLVMKDVTIEDNANFVFLTNTLRSRPLDKLSVAVPAGSVLKVNTHVHNGPFPELQKIHEELANRNPQRSSLCYPLVESDFGTQRMVSGKRMLLGSTYTVVDNAAEDSLKVEAPYRYDY